MSGVFTALAHKLVGKWSVSWKLTSENLNLYWTIRISLPILCFCWVFSAWWFITQRLGVVKNPTPTQSFLKCMFMVSFPQGPSGFVTAAVLRQPHKLRPGILLSLSCTSLKTYSNQWRGTHSVTKVEVPSRIITELCFKPFCCWTFWHIKTELLVLGKNIEGDIMSYKIICFLCKNTCN